MTTGHLAVYPSSPALLHYLQTMLGGSPAVVGCGSPAELSAAVVTRDVSVVLLDLHRERDRELACLVRGLRGQFPDLVIAVLCEFTAPLVQRCVALVRAGADACLFQGTDDTRRALCATLAEARLGRIAESVATQLAPHLAPPAMTIVRAVLRRVDCSPSVDDVAADLRVHRRTLVNRLEAAGCPGPAELISWCRLMVAGHLLESPGHSVEHVALRLGFGSGTALRNMLQRYLGMTPGQLRARGGGAWIVSAFHGRLRAGMETRRIDATRPYGDARVEREFAFGMAAS